MSITSPDARISEYAPVVPTTDFPATFPVFDNDDIKVFVEGVERDDFAVSATYVEGISNNAKAVFSIGITGSVQVVGARDPHRTNRFNNGGPLPVRDHNLALDTVEAELQETRRDIGRAVKAAYGTEGPNLPASDGSSLLGWDGDNLVNRDLDAAKLAAAEAAAEAAIKAFDDFIAASNPLFAVKLNTVTADGNLDYPLASSVPAVNGHLYVSSYVNGIKQPKDGQSYSIVDDGGTLRLSEYPGDGITIYVEGSAAYAVAADSTMPFVFDSEAAFEGATIPNSYNFVDVAGETAPGEGSGKRWRRLADAPLPIQPWHKQVDNKWFEIGMPDGPSVSVLAFGVRLSASQSPAQRRAKLQAAIDWAALKRYRLDFPGSALIVDGDVYFRDSSWFYGAIGAGIRLADDASVECCGLRPFDWDVKTSNVRIEGLTFDANADRPAVTGLPLNRPGGSGFASGWTEWLWLHRCKGINGVLHGIDICPGGDLDDNGNRQYVYPPGARSTKRPRYWFLTECEGAYCGDDAITFHSTDLGYFRDLYGHSAVRRFSSGSSMQGIEIDDDSQDIVGHGLKAHDVVRGVSVKNHYSAPAARRIHLSGVDTWRCNQGLFITDETENPAGTEAVGVFVSGFKFREPLRFDELATPSLSALQVRGHTGAIITGIDIDGAGAAEALGNAILMTGGALACQVSDYTVRNWGSGTTSVISIGATTKGNSLVNGRLLDCDAMIGISVLGYNQHRVSGVLGLGGPAGAVLISTEQSPWISGSQFTEISGDYTYPVSYAGSNRTISQEVRLNDTFIAGMLQAGGATAVSVRRHHLEVSGAARADEILQLTGANVSARWYEGGNGAFGASSAAAVLRMTKDAVTDRSIGAAGSINASGADYAEYHEVKPHLWGSVPKGAILGFASDGLLTDRFADVVGLFVVKSTSPYGTGGDDWGSEEKVCAAQGCAPVGPEPVMSFVPGPADEENPAAMAAYRAAVASAQASHAADLNAWKARQTAFNLAYEAERAKRDRIAKSGYVPVNIPATTADIGKYLVPIDDGSGGITANLRDMNAAEDAATTIAALKAVQKAYRRSIGVVIGIAADGRPLIEVKVG